MIDTLVKKRKGHTDRNKEKAIGGGRQRLEQHSYQPEAAWSHPKQGRGQERLFLAASGGAKLQ